MKLLIRFRGFVLLLALFALAQIATAQVDTGAIVGTVVDSGGAIIPNATITVVEQNTGIKTIVTASTNGNYSISPLKLGTYRVTAEKQGFKTTVRQNVDVSIQSRLEVNFQLEVGAINEVVQVESTSPILETQSSSIQQLVEARAINNLPLNGRNASFLAQLSPGVTFAQNDSRNLQGSGSFTANGMRRTQNNYLLDGMDNNVAIGDIVNQAQYVIMPPPDALREFTVQTSNYSAEFGHSAGAVLNISTKSGTNAFHGNVWWFVRNDIFDGKDYFVLPGQRKPKYRQNQFGGTFGGPVRIPGLYDGRDRTFFFVDYQGTRVRQGKTYTTTVPTLAERNSNFTNLNDLITLQTGTRTDALSRVFPYGTVFDPATTRVIPAGGVDPVTGLTGAAGSYVRDPFYSGSVAGKLNYSDAASIALLNQIPANRIFDSSGNSTAVNLLKLYPTPNSAAVKLSANYTTSPTVINDTNSFDVRLDHNFTSKDSAFARYSYLHNNQVNPGPFPGIADGASSRPGTGYTESQNGALSWTHIISSHLVNEARVGYSRVFDKRLQPGATAYGIPDQYGIPGVPQVNQNGGLPLFEFGQLSNLGAATTLPSDKASNVWQATENLSIDRSKHQIRTGFEFQNVAFPMATPTQPRGDFSHSGIYTSIVNTTDNFTDRAQFILQPKTSTVGGPNYVGGANSIQATNFPSVFHPARRYYGAYIQDSWRVSTSLTINAGLRYEFLGIPAERDGRIGNLQSSYTGDTKDGISRYYIPKQHVGELTTSVVNALTANNVVITPTNDNSIGIAQKTNFAPRFGVAFQPHPKFSIRGGYGLFYQANENHGLSISPYINFPFQVSNNYTGGSAINSIATATNNAVGAVSQGLQNISLQPSVVSGTAITFQGEPRYPKTAYGQAYSLQVQYQLSPDTIFFVGYVGSNARHVQLSLGTNTTNQIRSANITLATISFFNSTSTACQPQSTTCTMTTGGTYLSRNGSNNYNSLQFGAERRFHNGLAFTANMTYARCLGNNRDLLDNGVGGLRAPYVPGVGAGADYGLCDIQVKRIVHTSGTYELPFGHGKSHLKSGVASWIAGGWSTNWIFTAQDGQPQSPTCPTITTSGLGCFAFRNTSVNPYSKSGIVQHFYNASAFIAPPAVPTGGTGTITNLGGSPSQVTGPPFRRLDMSLFRKFPFVHESYFELRAEVFNVTNTPNFGQPGNLNYTASNFGQITTTRDNPNDPREMQFSAKYYF